MMLRVKQFCLFSVLCVLPGFLPALVYAADAPGLIAQWNFDEGDGDIARDISGHGNDLELGGATWQRQGDGFSLNLDGFDDYARRESLGINGPVTIEAWVKPMRKPDGLSLLIGEGLQRYQITFYNTEACDMFIAAGGNNARGHLTLYEWNHVAGTYDGQMISMWVNGRLAHTRESKHESYRTEAGDFTIGTRGRPDLPRFKGLLDKIRVYDRSLSEAEIVSHFKGEATEYGFDAIRFSRMKVTQYNYFDRGEIVVATDYRGLQPFQVKGSLLVTLADKRNSDHVLQQQVVDSLPDHGVAEVSLSTGKLADGDYVIRVELQVGEKSWPVEEVAFSYPTKPSALPAPAAELVPELPAVQKPTPFTIQVKEAGGFELTSQGVSYAVESRISWPDGDFNRLASDDKPNPGAEKSWQTSVRTINQNQYEVKAAGDFYTLDREIKVLPTHVYVKDKYTNTTDNDLGLLIYNEIPIEPEQLTQSMLSGNEKRGRLPVKIYPDYGPTLFFADDKNGIGVIPIDDVYTIQAVPYMENGAAGVCTETFALAPGKSYTLEWAVYPVGSRDYYDFINNFRNAEGRIGTVEGAPGFITWGPMNRRQVPDKDFIAKRGLKTGIIHVLGRLADDPELSVNGLAFMNYPLEMQLLKEQATAIHRKHPGLKTVFHIAPSLYLTNTPEKTFPDSKVIRANGKQAEWGPSVPYFSQRRIDEGWTWKVYYPTPGNSFHDELIHSVDVMMDEMGFDGAFMDGFFAAYQGLWSYDTDLRWDGHSAEIDRKTKTIQRKVNSVLLLSQPSMIEFARKIHDKGGVVIGNSAVFTRSIAAEKYIIFDSEVASGPALHTAPSVTALRGGSSDTDKDIYLDMLDKLSWGMLFIYYGERVDLSYPSLAAKQFPMTFEEIRSGMVRGKERIVTMNSGVYGWPENRSLHVVSKFDDRGVQVSHDFTTTVGPDSVRTELNFGKNESAVIEPIPIKIETSSPVNTRIVEFEDSSVKILMNGQGEATLKLFVGTGYPDRRDGVLTDGGVNPGDVGIGDPYRVTIDGQTSTLEERDGTLSVPLKLDGLVELTITNE